MHRDPAHTGRGGRPAPRAQGVRRAPRAGLPAVLLALSLAALALPVASCSKKPPLTPPEGPPAESIGAIDWVLKPAGIKIGVLADPDLNTGQSGGGPAALMVCLYQLSDPGWFASNMKSSQGLAELVACPPAPAAASAVPASVPVKGLVTAERYFFQPGERRDLTIDRQPGTQFVGVAGGFMTMPGQGGAAYLPIPIYFDKKLIFADTYEPMELRAWLVLRNQLLAFYPKSEDSYDLVVADINPDGSVKKPEKRSRGTRAKRIDPAPAYVPCPGAWTLKPGETWVCPAERGGEPTAPVAVPAAQPAAAQPAAAQPAAGQPAAPGQAPLPPPPQGPAVLPQAPGPSSGAASPPAAPAAVQARQPGQPAQAAPAAQARAAPAQQAPAAGAAPAEAGPPPQPGQIPGGPSRALGLPSEPVTSSRATPPPPGASGSPPLVRPLAAPPGQAAPGPQPQGAGGQGDPGSLSDLMQNPGVSAVRSAASAADNVQRARSGLPD